MQVAETVQDDKSDADEGAPTANFIVSIAVQNATGSDLAGMDESLAQQGEMGMEAPPVMYGDTAYVSADSIAQAAKEGTKLQGPVQPSQECGGKFASEAFDVHMAERMAVCPAGRQSVRCYSITSDGKSKCRFEWNAQDCAACALRTRCFSEAGDCKKLTVGWNHHLLQQRRRDMNTAEFQQDMHHRNGIEGTISELVRGHGMRRARYRGNAKLCLQAWFAGAACNLQRLHRRQLWLARATTT